MKCRNIEKKLSLYINNELPNSDNILIESHLQKCSSCSKLYKNLNETLALLKPTEDIEEHPFYYTRLKQRMENKIDSKASILETILRKKSMQAILYLGSIIIAVFLGIQIGSNSNNTNQFTELDANEDYLDTFSKSQYFNGFEIETEENTFIVYEIETEE